MTCIVQKYGGTSVGSVERLQAVADRVQRWHNKGKRLVVVLSAMSGETNRLVELCQALSPNPEGDAMDTVLSSGEQVTIGLLTLALQARQIKAKSFCGWQVPIKTDSAYNKARIESIDQANIMQQLEAGYVVVIAGFQGISRENRMTTLGRGGSDTTAVALAAALNAEECQIYTDVDGVYTTDPRIEQHARKIDHISFEEMLEMASAGSKVLQTRSAEFAHKYGVNLRVLSSMSDDETGTLICHEGENDMEKPIVSSIAVNRNEAKITICGVPDKPGIAAQIMRVIADNNINVDVIVQNVGHNETTDFSFTIDRSEHNNALACLQPVVETIDAEKLESDDGICKLSVIGIGMRSHPGVATKVFETLSNAGINIQMISTSEIKLTTIIAEKYLELAVRELHTAFDLANAPQSTPTN